jgi:hypothetical protein
MKNNFTSFEQSKRLIELGVPVDSADCVGYIVDKSIDICNEYFQKGETRITAINPRHTYTQVTTLKYGEVWIDEPFPCWSVGRLIDIINNSTKLGYLVLYSSDILIERLIKVIENHSKFNEIDFSKLEE